MISIKRQGHLFSICDDQTKTTLHIRISHPKSYLRLWVIQTAFRAILWAVR